MRTPKLARIVQLSMLASLASLIWGAAACGGGAEEEPAAQTPEPAMMVSDAAALEAAATVDASPPPPKLSMLEMQHAVEKALVADVSDAKKTAALYAPDAVVWTPGAPETRGREAIQKSLEAFNGLFASLATVDLRVWTHRSTMAIHFVTTGTDKTSSKPVGGNGLEVLTLNEDGLIATDHTYYDVETLLQQTGVYKGTRPVPAVPSVPSISSGLAAAPEWHDAKGDATETTGIANAQAMTAAWLQKADDVYFGTFAGGFKGYDYAGDPAKSRDVKFVRASLTEARKTTEATDRKDVAVFGVDDFSIDEQATTYVQKSSKKTFTVHSAEVDQWKDGKLAASWTWSDNLERDIQLQTGAAAPAKTKPAAKH